MNLQEIAVHLLPHSGCWSYDKGSESMHPVVGPKADVSRPIIRLTAANLQTAI